MKTIWIEIRDHQIKGERLLLQGLRNQSDGIYRTELYNETKRTNQQNKYFHVLFTLLQKALYDAGYEDITTMEKAKDEIKRIFLTYEAVNKMTGEKYPVTRGTSELSKDEGIEFIERVLKFAAEELGFYIPTTEEFQANPEKWSLAALAV
jgi:hypothetical protein